MNAPLLAGPSVFLRATKPADIQDYLRWWNDPSIIRYLNFGTFPTRNDREEIRREEAEKPSAEISWSICLSETGASIGSLCLSAVDGLRRSARLGITIGATQLWGMGYGGEAIELAIRHAFTTLDLLRMELDVFAFNERAIRCYRRLGFHEEMRLQRKRFQQEKDSDLLLMTLQREEWAAAPAVQ